MRDSLFVKQSYFTHSVFIGWNVIICFLFLILPLRDMKMIPFSIVGIFISIFLSIIASKFFNSFGLYIYEYENSVYFKKFHRKKIDIKKISKIRITKAIIRTGTKYNEIDTELTDKSGKQMYSMLFFDEYIPDAMLQRDLGDREFRSLFSEHLLFYTIYDQVAIDRLKAMNPNIIVIPANQDALGLRNGEEQY